jgi:penicillin-binding protein 2
MNVLFEPHEQQPPRSGLLLLQILVLVLFCAFSIRLWYLQIHEGQEFAEKALENQRRIESIHAQRGLIKAAGGELLAVNEPAYALGLVREDCRGEAQIQATLAQVGQWTGIGLDKLREVYKRNKRRAKPFETLLLLPDLSFEQLAVIEANIFRWPGLEILTRSRRSYVQGRLMAHILGYVADANEEELERDAGLSLGDYVGKQGIENMLERRLRGDKGRRQVEVDVSGRRLTESVVKAPRAGEDLNLSIDFGLQRLAAGLLEGKAGAVVVMDPDTGSFPALVSSPSYDPNAFTQGLSPERWEDLRDDPMHPLQNRVTQSVYPPGSVFKLIMAGCGLAEGLLDPRETAHCTGSIKLGKHEFRCWRKGGHGTVNLQRALVESCDVYFYKLGMKLGVDRVSRYAKACGFNAVTGIDLPHEKPGIIPSREWKEKRFGERWQRGEDLNLAIGQGYTLVSPLQVARYVAALINGGNLLKPNLVAGDAPTVTGRIPLTPEQMGIIKRAMIATVEDPSGTCRRILTPGVVAGAKTGTAQVVRLTEELKAKKEYDIPYEFRDHAWMVGFAERGERRYVIVAMVEHGLHGASGAGPVLKAVIDYLFGRPQPAAHKPAEAAAVRPAPPPAGSPGRAVLAEGTAGAGQARRSPDAH